MGGNAFPDLPIRRILPAEYVRVRKECKRIVEQFYDTVVCPRESPEKDDYGDVDLLVCGQAQEFSPGRLFKALKAVGRTNDRKIISFAIPLDRENETAYVQLDLRSCGKDYLEWETWMSAFGDLSQIITVLIQPLGLRMTYTGLFVKVPEGIISNQEAPELLLSKNAVQVMQFLGLNDKKYGLGFRTMEDMFYWCSYGKFFQTPTTETGVRDRPVFDKFLQWATFHKEIWAKHKSTSKGEALKLALETFGVQKEYTLIVQRPSKFKNIAAALGSREGKPMPRFKRWIGFQDDGSPVLLPVNEANSDNEIEQNDWLDMVSEDRLDSFLVWIKENLTELERKEMVWVNRKSLDKKLAHNLTKVPKTGRQCFEEFKFNSERFKNELLICGILVSASDDEKLPRQYHSCQKTIEDWQQHYGENVTPDLYHEQNLHIVEEFRSLWAETEAALRALRECIRRPTYSACLNFIQQINDHLRTYPKSTKKAESDSDKEKGYAKKKLNFHFEALRQSLEQRLKDILDCLPEGERKVFDQFRFDSDEYAHELKICNIILENPSHPFPTPRTFHHIHSALTFISARLPHLNIELGHVKEARKLWMNTQTRLRVKKEVLSPSTFKGCQDLIRQVLLHLNLYARSLSGEGQIERSSGMLLIQTLGANFARPELKYKKEKIPGESHHREGQDSFRKGLIAYYACQDQNKIWCPVLGQWALKTKCTAAHIVPYSFPPHILKSLLLPEDPIGMYSEPSEPSMVPQNGLYLYNPVEKALDDGQLVIVPRLKGNDHIDFKVHLLDESLMADDATYEFNGQQEKWKALEGKSLHFQNQNFPAKNFLFLHILLTVVRKCIYQPPGWAYRLTEFIDVKEQIPVSPHPYLIDSLFMKLSKLITDVAVFKQIQATIPMALMKLPERGSKEEVREVSEENDIVVADLFSLLRVNSEDVNDLGSEGVDGEASEDNDNPG